MRIAFSASCSLKGNRSDFAKRLRHPLCQSFRAPRRPVDRHQPGVEIGRLEREPERTPGSLKLPHQRIVALEVHKEDHVVGGGERPAAEIELARRENPGRTISMSELTVTIRSISAGRMSSRKRRRKTAREKRPLPLRLELKREKSSVISAIRSRSARGSLSKPGVTSPGSQMRTISWRASGSASISEAIARTAGGKNVRSGVKQKAVRIPSPRSAPVRRRLPVYPELPIPETLAEGPSG